MKISNEKMVIHAETLSYHFLRRNKSLKELYAPNLKVVGGCFLFYNPKIDKSKFKVRI